MHVQNCMSNTACPEYCKQVGRIQKRRTRQKEPPRIRVCNVYQHLPCQAVAMTRVQVQMHACAFQTARLPGTSMRGASWRASGSIPMALLLPQRKRLHVVVTCFLQLLACYMVPPAVVAFPGLGFPSCNSHADLVLGSPSLTILVSLVAVRTR